MTALLEAQNVSKVFGGGIVRKNQTIALERFSFEISAEQPSVTAIVGESGSGKTTAARILLGLIAPTTGTVLYQGRDLQQLSGTDRRAFLSDVQTVFQDPFEVYNPFYKVDHVLETPIRNFKLARSKQEVKELMRTALETVGLRPDETLGRYPHQLSGGQRQRIMVARALLLKPRIIIADEPVSMVDASLRATILESLLKLNREFGISIVYITHDLTTAFQISQDVIVLYQGSVVEAGSADLVVPTPQHPYTRLLVGSIPLPDPKKKWLGERVLGAPSEGLLPSGDSYCRFYERCPYAMQQCIDAKPPLFVTDPTRVTSCYLFQESPQIPPEEIVDVLEQARTPGSALNHAVVDS
ncbi:MAG: ABC transporter ATP-binding protein [Thermomicrobiales bacterium]